MTIEVLLDQFQHPTHASGKIFGKIFGKISTAIEN